MINKITVDSIVSEAQFLLKLRDAIDEMDRLVLHPIANSVMQSSDRSPGHEWAACVRIARSFIRRNGSASNELALHRLTQKIKRLEFDDDTDKQTFSHLLDRYNASQIALRTIAYEVRTTIYSDEDIENKAIHQFRDLQKAQDDLVDFIDDSLRKKGIAICQVPRPNYPFSPSSL